MNRRRWTQVDRLLQEALEHPLAEREAFVRQASATDPALGDEVLSILRHADAADDFLEPAGAPPRLHAGDALGPYAIVEFVGEGGMGQVYRAHDGRLTRDVAVKVLPPAIASDADRLRRFEEEARAAAALSHPNILAVHDVGREGPHAYFVTEFLSGETLQEALAARTRSAAKIAEPALPVDRAVTYAIQIAHGLAAAHAQGIVHRDLKPANVFITDDGHVKILDFGLAKRVTSSRESLASPPAAVIAPPSATQSGMSAMLGTAGYMSPEQVRGQSVDARADIFAFGCVLYEMLSGRRAFQGLTLIDTMNAILNDTPVPVDQASARVIPRPLALIVSRCLAKDPAARFQTAADLAFALQALESGTARTAAAPVSLPGRRAVATLAIATAAFAALAAWGWLTRQDTSEGVVQRLPLTLNSPKRLRSLYSPGVRLSPDGRKLAYLGIGSGWQVMDLETGAVRRASGQVGGQGFAFSPTGDAAAMTSGGRLQQIYIVDLATDRATKLADCCGGHLSQWDRDNWVYHVNPAQDLMRTHAIEGRQEVLELAADHPNRRLSMARSVGSSTIVFTRTDPTRNPALAEVWAKDLVNGRRAALHQGVEALPLASGHLLILQSDGTLLASRLDSETLQLSTRPVPVVHGLEIRQVGQSVPNGSFEVSADGTLAYVQARPIQEDVVLTVDRAGLARGDAMPWGGWVTAAARSHDGKRWTVLVSRNLTVANIWAQAEGETEARRLTFSDNIDNFPQFVPHSTDVAFIGSTGGKNWDLLRVPFGGGHKPEVILDLDGDISDPRFSADGRWVVFCERSLQGQVDIRALKIGSQSAPITLVATPAFDCSPELSPDGRWLAYESTESGRAEAYVEPFPNPTGQRWQVTTDGPVVPTLTGGGGRRSPRWSSTGRELFYIGDNRMVSRRVATGSAFSLGTPQVLFQIPDDMTWLREVLPEGQGFLMARRNLEAPGQVIIIKNFLTLLEQKVGR